MKIVNLFTLSLSLLAFSSYELSAQGSGSSSYGTGTNPYGRNSNTNSNVYDDTAFEVVRQTKGNILSLEPDYITIKTKKNKLVKIQLTQETSFRRKKFDMIREELMEGQLVKVFYRPKNNSQPVDQAVSVRLVE